MEKNLLTKWGEIYLKFNLKELKFKLKPKVIEELTRARSLGDLSENSEYHSAKNQLFIIEKKISNLEKLFSNYKIINLKDIKDKNIIEFSALIELLDLESKKIYNYQIVNNEEINIKPGLISINSPLSKLLIGKSLNDIITLNKLNKKIKYKIISIKYI